MHCFVQVLRVLGGSELGSTGFSIACKGYGGMGSHSCNIVDLPKTTQICLGSGACFLCASHVMAIISTIHHVGCRRNNQKRNHVCNSANRAQHLGNCNLSWCCKGFGLPALWLYTNRGRRMQRYGCCVPLRKSARVGNNSYCVGVVLDSSGCVKLADTEKL